jgi:hypothetical protein
MEEFVRLHHQRTQPHNHFRNAMSTHVGEVTGNHSDNRGAQHHPSVVDLNDTYDGNLSNYTSLFYDNQSYFNVAQYELESDYLLIDSGL